VPRAPSLQLAVVLTENAAADDPKGAARGTEPSRAHAAARAHAPRRARGWVGRTLENGLEKSELGGLQRSSARAARAARRVRAAARAWVRAA